LGGPERKTFRECLDLVLSIIERKRLLAPVPWPAARILGAVAQHLPGRLLTSDQVRQLGIDNIVSEAARREGRTLAAFRKDPTSLAAILPTYLVRFRRYGQFEPRRLA
jgi:NADH dehydrogenase